MKELVIISGKGGTGKTSVTASLAVLAENAVLADCDVDAADLHLILEPAASEQGEFKSGQLATIDEDSCIACGQCEAVCRFGAVTKADNAYRIDPLGCEGCKTCEIVCPANAISMRENICGKWYISKTRCGTMVHAALKPGSENSGKLVSLVRKKAREQAEKSGTSMIIVDGPPGIGCPVIASIGGASMVMIVTEPTQSGLHDLKRVIGLAAHFKVPACACINKYDINEDLSYSIEKFCNNNGVEVLGKIPYDLHVTKSMLKKKSIVEYSDGDSSAEIRNIWTAIKLKLRN
ncbi:MAG TPA: ATP-binding protein [bacterium]|nr:MAG: ferredoxin [bacterium ADurb.Bin270]HPW45973.1 ATP-binding protein [bacterium]HQC50263.1 ATP-binding protein [bacterium]